MKDFSKEELEAERPLIDVGNTINFCLDALYSDSEHIIADEVVHGLIFEELIGGLLLARDQHTRGR